MCPNQHVPHNLRVIPLQCSDEFIIHDTDLENIKEVNDTAKTCHVFNYTNASTAYRFLTTCIVKEYPDEVLNEDGSIRHYTYTWHDGGRSLVRCIRCGAMLLYQCSEYHNIFDDTGDSLYVDLFPVESEKEADRLNQAYSPMDLCSHIGRKYLSYTNDKVVWIE